MSKYTLRSLIEDCVRAKTRIAERRRSKRQDVYTEVWRALNAWIEDQLVQGKVRRIILLPHGMQCNSRADQVSSRGREHALTSPSLQGASIPNFGKLTWETYKCFVGARGEGEWKTRKRPVFVLAESFCRTHGLPWKKPTVPPELETCEETNFIKLAIKCVLTRNPRPTRSLAVLPGLTLLPHAQVLQQSQQGHGVQRLA